MTVVVNILDVDIMGIKQFRVLKWCLGAGSHGLQYAEIVLSKARDNCAYLVGYLEPRIPEQVMQSSIEE